MVGRVLSVRIKKSKGTMEDRSQIQLVAEKGILDDLYFEDVDRPLRQVLLLDENSLNENGYSHGGLCEQITVDFPTLQSLTNGTIVEVGSAKVEITGDCAPCKTMAGYLGEDPQTFVNKMMRKRGMLAKIITDGSVKSGDAVRISDGS